MQTVNDIRKAFLDFFARNGHKIVPSAPLVPQDDPTLLFVNAGMVPFKNRFTGLEKGDYTRATSSQKCVRAGGKHNDLDNVGYTARHHTFFEMLGNFSFGDYFKEDAIALAWDMVTKEFSLPKDRLLITIYKDDEDAAKIWKKVAGLSDDKIIRIGTSDNFWSMGDTGPCGPCSEIFFDHGAHIAGGPPGSPDEDGDRFIEIWNLVFMQYNQNKDGSRVDLPAPSIDTGMGLERMAALLQGKHDNYETDLMRSLIESSASLSQTEPDGDFHFSHRILADHLRSSCFLMADGVLPSNEGRGYVLRRIMRRAMRHAHILGHEGPFMHKLVPSLITKMGKAYPDLVRAESLLTENFKLEETAFLKTLSRGLDLLEDATRTLEAGDILDGHIAFKLYDTYGFPFDLTEDILRSKNMRVDQASFDAAMAEQKQKARASWTGGDQENSDKIWFDLKNKDIVSEFVGYEQHQTKAEIIAMAQNDKAIQSAKAGDDIEIVLDVTPFYAESGGQCGDTGQIIGDDFKISVSDTQKKIGQYHVSIGTVEEGQVQIGAKVSAEIAEIERAKIRANHSATHLLHEALRRTVGDVVTQKGSQVTAQNLRFDFSAPKPLTPQQIRTVEDEVNQVIRENTEVYTEILTQDEAKTRGALALFGEKYGDKVRVIFMGTRKSEERPFSVELCGGTHVMALGDIGLCVITSESGVSSGVRRIEALTGQAALNHINKSRDLTDSLSAFFKISSDQLEKRVMSLSDEKKLLEKQVSELKQIIALGGGGNSTSEAEDINGVKFVGKILQDISPKDLAPLIDAEKQKIGSGVIILIAINGPKAGIAVGVTEDMTKSYHAVELVKIASATLGGKGGGGRPDFAQAGGSDISAAEKAIADVRAQI
ncbi:MAG: alanine--tRNA ligase [Pseudomonadota bacterium]